MLYCISLFKIVVHHLTSSFVLSHFFLAFPFIPLASLVPLSPNLTPLLYSWDLGLVPLLIYLNLHFKYMCITWGGSPNPVPSPQTYQNSQLNLGRPEPEYEYFNG